MKQRPLILLLLLLLLPALACGLELGDDGPPRNAVVAPVTANSSLGPWLEGVVADFNEAGEETAGGDAIWIELTLTDAGQAVTDIAGGAEAAMWIPDTAGWAHVLAQEGADRYSADCVSVARSPLVIAMWRPAAEALGWPGRDLGWLDIGSLAADPGAWEYYSGGQFGDVLRLGHTHPGLSASGAGTLLAIVQAAEAKTEAVDESDIQQPIVQASVGAFEGAVSWFSSSTGTLAQTMSERGVDFLGAAIMYESDVISAGAGDPGLVPIYPFEGTFVADHPACLDSDADGQVREAAARFREYLLLEETQAAAVQHGLRPVNDAVAVGAPLDQSRGVDLAQPEVVFEEPTVEAIYAIQDLWQSARKDVNLVMLLDVSGSMSGGKMESVRRSAVQFVEQMGDDDYLSIISFSSTPQPLVKHQRVGDDRQNIINTIQNLQARGDTALYDAIGDGASLLSNTASSETSNALVVLTDGLDTSSFRYNSESAAQALADGDATVFTIAFGNDADEALLERLALRANGNFFHGDEASIAAIYEEMSAAFGGAVGVGR
ncbi:MAG TPA: VWA domain-containing protein [Candidatus Sulfomarinibacteraceae bacterium]|nr:VWA domain-containing protein [Candidatus Sulfomarinibacteraceae bacterium]